MGRPINTTPLPPHPAVGADYQMVRMYGRTALCAEVTCPHPQCGSRRWYPLSVLRQQLARPNYNGQCRKCGQRESRTGYFGWARRSNVQRRSVSSGGYVVVGPTAVSPEHLPIFRVMQNRNYGVMEHRLVMAVSLGRPLKANELVDHMDGDKVNNDISNLRLYIKGKQQPGSHNGYGTYYHEWQVAETQVRELEARLAAVLLHV